MENACFMELARRTIEYQMLVTLVCIHEYTRPQIDGEELRLQSTDIIYRLGFLGRRCSLLDQLTEFLPRLNIE